MGTGKLAAVAMIAALGMSPIASGANASTADGIWNIRTLAVQVFDCANLVCGRVVGVNDPEKRSGVCGRIIVWNLTQNGPSEWTDGWIFDPDDNDTYHISATLEPDDTLRARIYSGIPLFGRTEVLKRIPPRSMPGWC